MKMPRKNGSTKYAAMRALKMNAVIQVKKKASPTGDKDSDCSTVSKIEESIQLKSLSGPDQSPKSLTVSEIYGKDPTLAHQSFEQLITETASGTNISPNLLTDSETQGKDLTPAQVSVEHLSIEFSTPQNLPVDGRRIIDIGYFFSKLQDISQHGFMNCGLSCVEIVGERQVGLLSKFTLKCRMCREFFYLDNDPPGAININNCAVAGTIAIGCGHSQLQELSAALNLPIITPKTYKACHCKLSTHWEKVSVESMNAAAQKEREMAIAEGRLDENGIPVIDIIVDGCWCKRTYKKNYSALSGAAAIIGKNSGEVLYLGVKNKYCSICAQSDKVNKVAKEHLCYKNYTGPSTAMESTILVESFKCSIEMHNLIYGRMVSDGDSSTHVQLLKSRPYPHITVEKIECRNHLLRNLCNKLTALQTDTKFLIRHRKVITHKKIMILRKTIRKIIKGHKADSEAERRRNIELLYNDLLLAHLHAFDDHTRCKPIFCNVRQGELQSTKNDFYTTTLWSRICHLMSNLASHAPSLIHDIDSNTVERYNSIIAKLVGGKRINFSKRGSYQTRCHAAVVSFNTHKVISSVYKSMAGHIPRGSIKKLESRRIKTAMLMRKCLRKKNRMLFSKGEDINYGDKCEKPDMPSNMFEKEKNTFLQNLIKTREEKQKIERDTVLQSSCSEWLELRRKLLTASNFGKVIKRRNDISCHNIVKDIIYKDSLSHIKSIKHGNDNEQKALKQLEVQENIKINPCGLYIDEEYHYLGATPDGVIDDETIVEMKCPLSAYEKDIKEVVKNKKLPFYSLKKDQDQLIINKTHNWFYQAQGQLHVTQKTKCLFAIWTGDFNKIKTKIILKDDEFWEHVMKPKLIRFYTECMLPELVDPRIPRNMKIRDPVYIQEAIDIREAKIKLKAKHTEKENEENEKSKNDKKTEQGGDQNIELKRKHAENEYRQKSIEQDKDQNIECVGTQGQNKKQKMCYEQNLYADQNVLIEQNHDADYFCNDVILRELNFNEF